jgi:hypothetical protein
VSKDPYAVLAALAIADAIDALVPDATRPAWSAWLALRFANHLTFAALAGPTSAAELALRDTVIELAPVPTAVATRARSLVDRALARDDEHDDRFGLLLAIATHDRALFERLAKLADRGDEAAIDALGDFGPELAPRLVELATQNTQSPGELAALRRDLARGDTRTAAWAAMREHAGELIARATGPEGRELIDATAALCEPAARAEVAGAFAPLVVRIPDGQRALDHALALIDRCIVRRAAAGDIAAALRR